MIYCVTHGFLKPGGAVHEDCGLRQVSKMSDLLLVQEMLLESLYDEHLDVKLVVCGDSRRLKEVYEKGLYPLFPHVPLVVNKLLGSEGATNTKKWIYSDVDGDQFPIKPKGPLPPRSAMNLRQSIPRRPLWGLMRKFQRWANQGDVIACVDRQFLFALGLANEQFRVATIFKADPKEKKVRMLIDPNCPESP